MRLSKADNRLQDEIDLNSDLLQDIPNEGGDLGHGELLRHEITQNLNGFKSEIQNSPNLTSMDQNLLSLIDNELIPKLDSAVNTNSINQVLNAVEDKVYNNGSEYAAKLLKILDGIQYQISNMFGTENTLAVKATKVEIAAKIRTVFAQQQAPNRLENDNFQATPLMPNNIGIGETYNSPVKDDRTMTKGENPPTSPEQVSPNMNDYTAIVGLMDGLDTQFNEMKAKIEEAYNKTSDRELWALLLKARKRLDAISPLIQDIHYKSIKKSQGN